MERARWIVMIFACLWVLSSEMAFGSLPAVRIKEMARVDGVRDNQLIGYGLVVGLDGTGDSPRTAFTMRSISNMLEQFDIHVDQKEVQVRNVAAVMVTATLPAFARPGDTIDVLVSSLGDAKSLQGGTLLLTPLMGADQQVYAVAQGSISIGGYNARSAGARVQTNHALVGRIPGGAIVEREVPINFIDENGRIRYVMDYNDFETAQRIAATINEHWHQSIAKAINARTIEIDVPEEYREAEILLISEIGQLEVVPDAVAKVVINERTGTVVMGQNVRVMPVAVTHGSLKVTIETTPILSQPYPHSRGETVVAEQSTITVEESGNVAVMGSGADIQAIVNALNKIGATPRDVIAIVQALKEAGALYADLVII